MILTKYFSLLDARAQSSEQHGWYCPQRTVGGTKTTFTIPYFEFHFHISFSNLLSPCLNFTIDFHISFFTSTFHFQKHFHPSTFFIAGGIAGFQVVWRGRRWSYHHNRAARAYKEGCTKYYIMNMRYWCVNDIQQARKARGRNITGVGGGSLIL